MASDNDFNRKSFTTGHTGFGIPFATWPDRADVPRNAARPLRYMDRYGTVSQGEVFYITGSIGTTGRIGKRACREYGAGCCLFHCSRDG